MNAAVVKAIDDAIGWHEIPPAWERFLAEPMTFADIRLFFGDQGQGKSISEMACVADDVYQYITHIISPEGEIIKARALTDDEIDYLETPIKEGGVGIVYDHLRHMRVYNDDATKSKIVSVPTNYSIETPVKIFANRTIYGMRYAPFLLELMIEKINTTLMNESWIALSEAILVSRKNTNSYLGNFMEWFGAECRKRHIRMVIDSQYKRQVLSVFHLYATTTVECTYDPETTIVDLAVNNSSPVMQSTAYLSFPYRRFFYTDEHMNVPQIKIDRALKSMGIKRVNEDEE